MSGVSAICPRPAAIGRAQDARARGGAGADPDVVAAEDRDVGAARGEGAFVRAARPAAGPAARASTCVPPSSVVRMTNAPSTESLTAMPWSASQNAIASKNAFGSSLVNCSVHVAPASVVL